MRKKCKKEKTDTISTMKRSLETQNDDTKKQQGKFSVNSRELNREKFDGDKLFF